MSTKTVSESIIESLGNIPESGTAKVVTGDLKDLESKSSDMLKYRMSRDNTGKVTVDILNKYGQSTVSITLPQ